MGEPGVPPRLAASADPGGERDGDDQEREGELDGRAGGTAVRDDYPAESSHSPVQV